jgi:thymidylate synthase (FAD)
MIAIKPYAEIMDIGNTCVDVLRKIEWIGRTCYKSTDQITDESAEKFVSGLIKRGHEAMLEHASFCFTMNDDTFYHLISEDMYLQRKVDNYKSFLRNTTDSMNLVSGNVRAWRNFFKTFNNYYGFLPLYAEQFIRENPTLFPEYQNYVFKNDRFNESVFQPVSHSHFVTANEFMTHCDVTVRWVVDRGISHELVRHRPASFAQESTRYCNYSQNKFGGQLTFIIPEFFEYGTPAWILWKAAMEGCETTYMAMMERGVSPEKARTVLPNSLKTEVIMTANCAEWKHFFELRACNVTGKAHPQMLEAARPLMDDFKDAISVIFDDLAYEQ